MVTSQPPNTAFRWVILTGGLFAFTAMCMFASALGHPQSPPNRFFNAYGIPLILVETVALVAVAFYAMAVDQRETRQAQKNQQAADTDAPSDATPTDSLSSESEARS